MNTDHINSSIDIVNINKYEYLIVNINIYNYINIYYFEYS